MTLLRVLTLLPLMLVGALAGTLFEGCVIGWRAGREAVQKLGDRLLKENETRKAARS